MREKAEERDALKSLVEITGLENLTMIEVGCYSGESSEIFASTGKVKTLWCIDPWKNGYDARDIASSSDFTAVEKKFDEMAERNPVVKKFKGTLADFVEAHPEVKPDLIYIDACHTYEAVKSDINLALKFCPKFISGHDFCSGWAGVMEAVRETLGEPDQTFADNSWIIDLRNEDRKDDN